jgi:hypothetical protein
MGPLDKDVVRDDALHADDCGFALELHHHWYRSLPLSSIATLDLTLDGEPVSSGDLTIHANQDTYTFAEIEEQFDKWWFTTDAITVTATRPGFTAGSRHRVELDLGLLIPYLIIGPPDDRRPLLAASHTDKQITSN